MVVRVPVNPALLGWAFNRSGLTEASVTRRFPKFGAWRTGDVIPTFVQLQAFANATHAPLGFLFLDEPPVELVPIPDFRTLRNSGVRGPSPDLLDTIYVCQMRQDWYREHARQEDAEPLKFVGSARRDSDVAQVANEIRAAIGFGIEERGRYANWEAALRQLIDAIEDIGVLVMISGIVGGNTHRKLDPEEFRGFALADTLAPLIFVNGSDTKAAQIFTLVHELAHIWIGETALSDARMARPVDNEAEVWANSVAAEVLVPLSAIRSDFREKVDSLELERLAKRYRVSSLVVLKRIFDAGFLAWDSYREKYDDELARIMSILSQQTSSGGNYYNTQPLRISRHFARAVIADTLEGRTLYRDAYGLLGTSKHETFSTLASQLLGVVA